MKKLFFLPLILLVVACSQQTEHTSTRISGTIENAGEQPVEFVFYRDFTNNHREIVTLEPDAQGNFTVSFQMPEPAMGTLRHGRTSIRLFLQPGDELQLQADASRWMETISLNGQAGTVNRCYVDYQRELETRYNQSFFTNAAKDTSPAEFESLMADVREQRMAFLQQCEGLSAEFRSFFETEVDYDIYSRLLAYPAMHQRLNQMDRLPELPEGYYSFLDQALELDESRLNSETYVNFLLAYLNHEATLQAVRASSPNQAVYVLAGEHLSGKSGEYIQAVAINREFSYGNLENAISMYQEFQANAQSGEIKARLNTTWEGIQSLMPGRPAPDFTMTDIHGNQVSLSDFRGKVVYLKFWASWCGPCMRQVPPAGELKKRLADQEDLVFMYISIDTDNEAWRNTIARNNISGVHFVTPGRERGVPALYQVKWIPTFYVIGRDGNIFQNRPLQPADPGVDEMLLEALAQEV